MALALVIGGVYVASRQQAANRAAARAVNAKPRMGASELEFEYEEAESIGAAPRNGKQSEGSVRESARAQNPSSMLLEGLKEELFQLEVEHKQGQISQQEYEQAKAALDATLQRALKREAKRV